LLNHPNVGAIYGLEESIDRTFLVLELVEGETLAGALARGRLPASEAVERALQITAALEEAHGKGVVHRDLKPANVKVTPDRQRADVLAPAEGVHHRRHRVVEAALELVGVEPGQRAGQRRQVAPPNLVELAHEYGVDRARRIGVDARHDAHEALAGLAELIERAEGRRQVGVQDLLHRHGLVAAGALKGVEQRQASSLTGCRRRAKTASSSASFLPKW
jgi:serine/threonine protein kinase